ncbi:hypothetical protein [Cupriavidus oxalaticus]|uniref:Uncharacterized protein n=1 Tax=Cupriavidus oxalaticus TaxID=96344 RepID=A0ABX7HRP7_9BURK|nr:hypothetical protein [Cupriavidus oxalaticus]QRQ88524.1 hypothetical protein JTE91_18310 [Cupriavidus oxalaticus]QRQ93150.1 hypothetical protein JTE92_23950 [Cupriavidus oxalaticus]WQD81760.1 hypothetical protein U0036_11685 [Cupriavidus oxalaticus]
MVEGEVKRQRGALAIGTTRETIQRLKQRLRWKAYWRFPNLIKAPDADPKYEEERDRKKNAATQVPNDEELSVPMLFGAELYGPAEIDRLYADLKRLGWDTPRFRSTLPNVIQWIRDQRLYGSEGHFNVGIVVRKTDKRFLHPSYLLELPEEFDYLTVTIYQLSASLTCVLVGMALTEQSASWYNDELAKLRKTKSVRNPKDRFISILGADHQKRRSIEEARERYRGLVTNWFKRELPGFFSNEAGVSRLPTAEVITTIRQHMFAPPNEFVRDEWRRMIWDRGYRRIWTDSGCPGLQLAIGELEDEARHHSVIGFRTSDVADSDLQHFGGRTKYALLTFCYERIEGVLVHYACTAFLQEASRTLKLSREQLFAKKGRKEILVVLERISDFFRASTGNPAVATDLLKNKPLISYKHHCNGFVGSSLFANDKDLDLAEVLHSRVRHLAEEFIEDEEATRQQFDQLSSILSTKESIRTQRRMEVITVIALVVALASLVAALPPITAWAKSIESLRSAIVKM